MKQFLETDIAEVPGFLESWKSKNIHANAMDMIGDTPIVMLSNMFKNQRVFGKLEYYNPTSSIKDRTAHYIVSKAEKMGKLKKGGSIIESSSGNFGLALSFIGLMKNYRVICVVDPRTQEYFLRMYTLLNAEIVMVDQIDNGSYQNARIKKAKELNKQIKNSFRPDQYDNFDNREAHYFTTGEEIVNQMRDIGLDYVVMGVSTGGTISGCGRRIKEEFPNCRIVAVDALGSTLFSEHAKKRFMTGLGSNYIPLNLDYTICDDVTLVNDREAFEMNRHLLREEFIYGGPSSGAVAVAIKKILEKETDKNPVILGVFPDNGGRYMNTVYDDTWCHNNIDGWCPIVGGEVRADEY